MNALPADIDCLLAEMRDLIERRRISFTERKKTMDTLSSLGISINDAICDIYDLQKTDYYSGPLCDRDFPSDTPLWVFKKKSHNELIYIKFKIQHIPTDILLVVSYHIDEQ